MSHRLQLLPLQAQDHAQVQTLFARQGWSQRSQAGWQWALFDSPQRPTPDTPAGWVLKGPEGIVGFLGNLPHRLWQDGRPLPAATCTALLVDAAWRGQGAALMRAFSAQGGVQLLFSATANAFSAPLYSLFRFQPGADAGMNQALRWVADGRAFAGHALRHLLQGRGWIASPAAATPAPGRARGLLRPLLSSALGMVGWPTVPTAAPARAARVSRWQPGAPGEADRWRERWQAWWARMLAAHPGLLADRQLDTVAWRLADPDLTDSLALWLLQDAKGELQGLALARAVAPAAPAVPRAELLDWCLLPDTPVPDQAALLGAVGQWATQRGLPFVEARRYTGLALQQLAGLRGRAVPLPAGANWMRPSPDGDTAPGLARWSMSCVDSDDWFCSHRVGPGP